LKIFKRGPDTLGFGGGSGREFKEKAKLGHPLLPEGVGNA